MFHLSIILFLFSVFFHFISPHEHLSIQAKDISKCRKRYGKKSIDNDIFLLKKNVDIEEDSLLSLLTWPDMRKTPLSRLEKDNANYEDHLSHLKNINNLDETYIQNRYSSIENLSYKKSNSLSSFLKKNKDALFFECRDSRIFSHCQQHYLLSYNSTSKEWIPYKQTPLNSDLKVDITMILSLSIDRINRLPLLLNHWPGPISIVLFCSVTELPNIEKLIKPYQHISRIQWHLYIHLLDEYKKCDDNYVMDIRKGKIFKDCHQIPIFPINLLRVIGLSAIHTSHFVVVDSDLIVSSSLYKDFLDLPDLLTAKEKNLFIFPTFMYNVSIVELCRENHNCTNLWARIPKTKKEINRLIGNQTMMLFSTPYHQIISINDWSLSTNKLFKLYCTNASLIEPYFIGKRTTINYSPYYINYGLNKIEFINRLRLEGFKFYIMINDFGIDLPHERTEYSINYRMRVKVKGREKKDPVYKMGYYYNSHIFYDHSDVIPMCSNNSIKGEYY